jgi:hypothetical protein
VDRSALRRGDLHDFSGAAAEVSVIMKTAVEGDFRNGVFGLGELAALMKLVL